MESKDEPPSSSRGSNNSVENYVRNQQNMQSSLAILDYDSMTDVVIDNITENEPTSALLDYCKRKFLRPYVQLLGFIGLYPLTADATRCGILFSHFQTIFIFVSLSVGYFLQYFSLFRRDRGFSNKTNFVYTSYTIYNPNYQNSQDIGDLLFAYVIPSTLHLFGFLSAVFVFRVADNEQLQNLIERVFIMSNAPKKLCLILWMHVLFGIFGIAFFVTYIVYACTTRLDILQISVFGKQNSEIHTTAKVLLIITIFIQDLVQIVVLTSYCVECYLLTLHLYNLKEKLVQHTIETIDWMREVLEFRKLLSHLNRRVAIPVCFFTVLNISYALAGLVYLFKEYNIDGPIKIFSMNIANVILWLIIGLTPFFKAAAVTKACRSTQASGHQIRIRPFVYHNTSSDDLDSTLMFASSLNMSAKLFRMPIQGNYLCFSILIISVAILTLGMCMNVSLGII